MTMTIDTIKEDLILHVGGQARPFYADKVADAWAIATRDVTHAVESPSIDEGGDADMAALDAVLDAAAEDVLKAIEETN